MRLKLQCKYDCFSEQRVCLNIKKSEQAIYYRLVSSFPLSSVSGCVETNPSNFIAFIQHIWKIIQAYYWPLILSTFTVHQLVILKASREKLTRNLLMIVHNVIVYTRSSTTKNTWGEWNHCLVNQIHSVCYPNSYLLKWSTFILFPRLPSDSGPKAECPCVQGSMLPSCRDEWVIALSHRPCFQWRNWVLGLAIFFQKIWVCHLALT